MAEKGKPQEIVDTHMHLWTPSTHPWVEKVRDGGHPAGKFGGLHSECKQALKCMLHCWGLDDMIAVSSMDA